MEDEGRDRPPNPAGSVTEHSRKGDSQPENSGEEERKKDEQTINKEPNGA